MDIPLSDNDEFIMTINPTFLLNLENEDYLDDDNWEEYKLEFGELPISVQREALNYFNSNKFIRDQIEEYVLKYIQVPSCCTTTYPIFNGKILDISFSRNRDILNIKLLGILKELPLKEYIKEYIEKYNNHLKKQPIDKHNPTRKDLMFQIKEGLGKASNSGPLISKYGRYIGEDIGRYSIYVDRVKTII